MKKIYARRWFKWLNIRLSRWTGWQGGYGILESIVRSIRKDYE